MKYKLLASIPIIIAIYLIYVNLLPFGGTMGYIIDVGVSDLQGNAKLTGPMDRISESNETDGITFRELQNGLVYFSLNSPYLESKGKVTVNITFMDKFPENGRFRLGAKNNETWSYALKDIYVPYYNDLIKYPHVEIDNRTVFLINSAPKISGLDDIPEGSVIATNTLLNLDPYVKMVKNTGGKNLSVNVALRGSHVFYTYVDNGELNLNISKQDLNWREGQDELEVRIYSEKDELIGNGTIPDDGNVNNSTVIGEIQKANFSFSNLKKGVYRINLAGGGDVLIRKIRTDKKKLVTDGRIFIAGDNPAYFEGNNSSSGEIYFKNPGKSTMEFQTYHNTGLQNITVENGKTKKVTINETQKKFNVSLAASGKLNSLVFEKGDVIIDSIDYFSFTKDSYFTPKRFKIVDIMNDPAWIEDNVDYVVLDYNIPKGDVWKSNNASWDLNELYKKDNELSFLLSAPHLGTEEFRNFTIPVDRIEIEVKVPPIWERI